MVRSACCAPPSSSMMAFDATKPSAGFPFDTIKTRMQVSPKGGDGGPSYRGPWHCIITTLRMEGIAGFYRGIVPPLIQVSRLEACTFEIMLQVGKKRESGGPSAMSPISTLDSNWSQTAATHFTQVANVEPGFYRSCFLTDRTISFNGAKSCEARLDL